MKNQSDFCLAYAITYRDFVGGTLGLAWVGSAAPGCYIMFGVDFCSNSFWSEKLVFFLGNFVYP